MALSWHGLKANGDLPKGAFDGIQKICSYACLYGVIFASLCLC